MGGWIEWVGWVGELEKGWLAKLSVCVYVAFLCSQGSVFSVVAARTPAGPASKSQSSLFHLILWESSGTTSLAARLQDILGSTSVAPSKP